MLHVHTEKQSLYLTQTYSKCITINLKRQIVPQSAATLLIEMVHPLYTCVTSINTHLQLISIK